MPHEREDDNRLVTAQRRGKMSPEMLAQLGAATADLAAHLADPTDAHDASAVSFAAFGTITSTDVQAAIQELDGEYKATDSLLAAAIADHIADTSDAHDASAITGLGEFVRDTMGAALVAGTGMTVTVNDGADTITLDSSGGGGAALTVEELDGIPTDSAVTKIVFPNGTLGIVGHVATYTPTGLSGGAHRAARVYNTATQSIANITWTSLTFNSERRDDATFHSTVSNTSRLTAQATGWHLLWANVRLDAANNGKGSRFYLNNATEIAVDFTSGDGAGTRILPPLSCLYYLTAGDYVEYQVYHTNGSSFSTTVEANAAPEFGIVELF